MDALFCPLAADVGNWADWANVTAALIVGAAVWRVSRKTNALADAANRTSESVAQLELQREAEAAKLRQHEQRLILVTMANSISVAWVAVKSADDLLRQDGFQAKLRERQVARDTLTDTLRQGLFTIPESVRARMHFVDIRVAAQILRAEGAIPIFQKALEGIGSTSGEVRALGVVQLAKAISRELEELASARTACQDACREAGLKVGPPPNSAPATESAPSSE